VEAAARVRAGEAYDFVALAADALAKLEVEGHLVAGSRVGIARSGIAVAVAQGARHRLFDRSELIHVPGIHVLGLLPAAIRSMTTFSGAICATAAHADAARQWLVFAASPATQSCKRLHGLEPAP